MNFADCDGEGRMATDALDTQNTKHKMLEGLMDLKNEGKKNIAAFSLEKEEDHWRSFNSKTNCTFCQTENLMWYHRGTASCNINVNSVFQQQ